MEREQRDRLKHLWEAGIKSVQKLVKITGLSRSTIYKNIKKLKQGDDLKRAPGSGRKCILKGNDRRRVSQIAVKNSLFSSAQIAEKAAVKGSPEVSRWTVWRTLRNLGYLKWLPRKVPNLSNKNKRDRVAWCLEHRMTDWTKVVFTDESLFLLFRNKVKEWGKKPRAKKTLQRGPQIMVWGGISYHGCTPLKMTTKTINAIEYIDTQ